MQQWRPENPAMTFDEVSMERSKSFVKALQVPSFSSDLISGFFLSDLNVVRIFSHFLVVWYHVFLGFICLFSTCIYFPGISWWIPPCDRHSSSLGLDFLWFNYNISFWSFIFAFLFISPVISDSSLILRIGQFKTGEEVPWNLVLYSVMDGSTIGFPLNGVSCKKEPWLCA